MILEIFSTFILFFIVGGYLNTAEITVEAILTSAGREKIANGNPLNITRFALADDEVDYNLYQADHPNGSEFAGDLILNMPLMEAFVDETQVMRYKLVTLPKNTSRLPVVTVPNLEYTLEGSGVQVEISPTTRNGDNSTLGYTAIVRDADVVNVGVAQGGSINATTGTIPAFLSDTDETRTQTAIGRRFVVTSNSVRTEPGQQFATTRMTIVGNETGGTVVLTFRVRPDDATTGA